MSHFFLFLSLQTCICMSLYQSLVWTSGQAFSHSEAVSKYNMNEKYPWNDLLPTAWHNLSLKPDGMCFTQGALAEEFVKKKTPMTVDVCWPCGILWALWRVEPQSSGASFSSLLRLPLLTAGVLCLHNYFIEFLFSALLGSKQQWLEERVNTSFFHFFLLPLKPNLHPYLFINEVG